MSKVKSDALAMIQALPDDVTWEQVAYRIVLRAKIEQGMAEIEAGHVIPHEVVKQEVAEWLASRGQKEPASSSK